MATVLVIGGGAAGCLAALTAANAGARVVLWEKNDRLGRKLAITGKGRCNITNAAPVDELIRNITGNGRFMYSALTAFDNQAVMQLFENLGVPLKVERGQRVFPVSDKAADVITALEKALAEAGVEIVYNAIAERLIVHDGAVIGAATKDGRLQAADAVILATGGATYRGTGSTGDGYRLAEQAGHSIIEPLPSLVPLVSPAAWVHTLTGLSLRNVELGIYKGGVISKKNCLGKLFGEMLFTHFGISGPMVLSLSRKAVVYWRDNPGEELLAAIDLKPALTEEQLLARLEREIAEAPKRQFHNMLVELLPKSLIEPFIMLSGIAADRKVVSLQKKERLRIVHLLKEFVLPLSGARPLNEGIVTCGGVNVREVTPKTFASKKAAGLYIVGELLDVDAFTGGYNLQVAFSSGHAAGLAAAGQL